VLQDDLGALAFSSCTRSADPTFVGEALVDDARTTTPPRGAVESRATSLPVPESRVETPHALLKREELHLGTLERRPPQELLTSTPSVQYLVGLKTWSGTNLRLTRRQEVQERPVHTSFELRLQDRGYHKGKLTGITPLGRMTFSKTMRMQALRTSIVTINHALTVSMLFNVLFLMILSECC
jgi:hypothetical protein